MQVSLERIEKSFGGAPALSNISLTIASGTVHGLVGENGAGKSTLGKIISGVMQPDAGRILVDGTETRFSGPHDALSAGIAIVQQELALVPELTVAENVFLGREPASYGFIRRGSLVEAFAALRHAYDFHIDGRRQVSSLSLAERQEVEILKAVARNAKFIVLDEPTSSLTPREVQRLHTMISRLREGQKTTIVYVSHFLDHVLSVCDTISVLRNGAHVRTAAAADETEASIVTAMLGRDMAELFPARGAVKSAPVPTLRVKSLTRRGAFEEITFDVWPGEVVGLTGLVGSGRSEVVRAVFGADPIDSGEIELEGAVLRLQRPGDAMHAGIAMVPESRREQGLVMGRSILENVSLNNFADDRTFGWVRRHRERQTVAGLIKQLNIKCRSMASPVWQLSGGNQQKVLFAKWIAEKPRVLILDEPTRGVDVGAKAEIYRLITSLAARGMSILIVSSEMEEVVGLCHRVHVMRQGRLVASFEGDQVQIGPILSTSLGAQGERHSGEPEGESRGAI